MRQMLNAVFSYDSLVVEQRLGGKRRKELTLLSVSTAEEMLHAGHEGAEQVGRGRASRRASNRPLRVLHLRQPRRRRHDEVGLL